MPPSGQRRVIMLKKRMKYRSHIIALLIAISTVKNICCTNVPDWCTNSYYPPNSDENSNTVDIVICSPRIDYPSTEVVKRDYKIAIYDSKQKILLSRTHTIEGPRGEPHVKWLDNSSLILELLAVEDREYISGRAKDLSDITPTRKLASFRYSFDTIEQAWGESRLSEEELRSITSDN